MFVRAGSSMITTRIQLEPDPDDGEYRGDPGCGRRNV